MLSHSTGNYGDMRWRRIRGFPLSLGQYRPTSGQAEWGRILHDWITFRTLPNLTSSCYDYKSLYLVHTFFKVLTEKFNYCFLFERLFITKTTLLRSKIHTHNINILKNDRKMPVFRCETERTHFNLKSLKLTKCCLTPICRGKTSSESHPRIRTTDLLLWGWTPFLSDLAYNIWMF